MMKGKKIFVAGAISAIGFSVAFGQADTRDAAVGPAPEQAEYGAPQQQREVTTRRTEMRDQRQNGEAENYRASSLMGSRVKNHNGERLGSVTDLVVDVDSGEVAYVIVSGGGLLGGIGGEMRPVPPDAFEVRPAEGIIGGIELILDVQEQQWRRAPSIRRDQLSRLEQDERSQEIRRFYTEGRETRQRQFGAPDRTEPGQTETEREVEVEVQEESDVEVETREFGAREPAVYEETEVDVERREPVVQEEVDVERREFGAREQEVQTERREVTTETRQQTAEESRFRLASRLIGERIRSEQHEEIGEVDDLIVNMSDGSLSFVLIQPNTTFWEMAREDYAVAPQSLRRLERGGLQLNVTPEELENSQLLTEAELQEQFAAGTGGDQIFRVEVTPGQPGVFGGRHREKSVERVRVEERTHAPRQETR
jgi:sporulation protein YlmC with PRC-barrel domain